MSDAKNVTEANLWCNKARELINQRTGKSKALKDAREQIKKAAENIEKLLEKLGLHDPGARGTFQAEYLKIAGEVQAAIAPKFNEQAVILGAGKLEGLSPRLNKAIEVQSKLTSDLNTFDQSYRKLEVDVSAAESWRGARLSGSTVRRALDEADNHLTEAARNRREAEEERATGKMTSAFARLEDVKADLVKAKDGAKLADKEAEADLAAMKDWNRTRPLVEQALAEVRGLAGAEDPIRLLQEKLDTANRKLVQQDGVWMGFKAALDELQGYAALAEQAKSAHLAYISKDLPDAVKNAQAEAEKALKACELVAPAYAAKALREDVIAASDLGRRDTTASVDKLQALTTHINDETQRLTREKTAAELAQKGLEDLIAGLKSRTVPPMLYEVAERRGNVVRDNEMANRQWTSATHFYQGVAQGLQSIEDAYAQYGQEWEAKKLKLEAMRQLAVQAMSVPVLARLAQDVRDACSEVKPPFDRFEFQASLQQYAGATLMVEVGGRTNKIGLEAAHAELEKRIRDGGIPVTDDTLRQRMVEELKYAMTVVHNAYLDGVDKVRRHIAASTLDPTQQQLLLAQELETLDKIEAGFIQRRSQSDGKDVEALTKQAIKELQAAAKAVTDKKAKALGEAVKSLQEERTRKRTLAAPAEMEKLLAHLEGLGVDVALERKLVDEQKDAPTKAYRDIWASLAKKEKEYWEGRARERAVARQAVTSEIDRALVDLPIAKGFKEELKQQAADIRHLIDSNDADLLAAALQMMDRLKKQISAINGAPELYKKNKKDLEKLAPRISELKDDLPETQRRLLTRLTEEQVESKHCAPDAMERRIQTLTAEIVKAEDARKQWKIDVGVYRERKTEVRELLAEVKKKTSTQVTEKAEAFEAWVEARVEEAKSLKKQEGRLPRAMEVLQDAKTQLESIMNAKNPRAVLRELDAVQVQDVRAMKDLAAQWHKDVSFFLEDTLPRAKEKNKADGGDETTVKGLEDLVAAAGKVVKPYLAVLTTLKIGAVDGPDFNKVKADFAQARQMFVNAQHAAARLTETAQSTNVQGPAKDGLNKLARKWSEKTLAYAATLRKVASQVRAAAKEDDSATKENAEKAARLVDALVPLFRSDAFAGSFAKLLEDPKALEKSKREALGRQQLAAREDALRVMRQFRADTAHPLLRKLCDAHANPFEPVSVTVAVSGIATTLKEIELQALASA